MDDFEHPILRHGRYRLLALSPRATYSAYPIRSNSDASLARSSPAFAFASACFASCTFFPSFGPSALKFGFNT